MHRAYLLGSEIIWPSLLILLCSLMLQLPNIC